MGADLNLMSRFYGVELGLKSTLSLIDITLSYDNNAILVKNIIKGYNFII